ncbi:SsgA family sporulation/cell division regulator [Allokutzneria albata]|uniref:Streptomyces sporulation and cell division protein, SsgA n=1 Tax=Allokutzneria albata TaxID=211114 RepID=A0A1G9W6J1_ALLAB|nr:SsgA family sporulation/cell division regulator [Allokutzneria albata]SDM79821.1 Streptomyces sporulation and cell division protein, SsgA [Allokutzneria albata]
MEHDEIRTTTMFNLLLAPAVTVEVELAYSTRDPYAIRMLFNPVRGKSVEWLLARDLLADGLLGEAGEGDVRLWPIAGPMNLVEIEFSTPAGQARFGADAEVLADFLNDSYLLVPSGEEALWFDFDQELALLGEA